MSGLKAPDHCNFFREPSAWRIASISIEIEARVENRARRAFDMARPPSTQPTDGELEILNILWDAGPSGLGLGRVHEALSARRPVALTTVATMLKTMRSKGLVVREDGPKGHNYAAAVSREAAVTGLVSKLLRHVFDGSARRLVAHLIQEGTLDERQRQEVLALLNAPDESPAAKPRKGGKR